MLLMTHPAFHKDDQFKHCQLLSGNQTACKKKMPKIERNEGLLVKWVVYTAKSS